MSARKHAPPASRFTVVKRDGAVLRGRLADCMASRAARRFATFEAILTPQKSRWAALERRAARGNAAGACSARARPR